MLNRFKIGTKLFGGFAIVLVLLFVVGWGGWYGTSHLSQMMTDLDAATSLNRDGIRMQNDIYMALFASANGAMYKDEKYAQEVQDIVAGIRREFAGMGDRIINDTVRATFRDVMGQVDRFGESNANYWKSEREREDVDAARDRNSRATMESIETLTNLIMTVTSEQFAITQEDTTYYNAERVQLIGNAGTLNNDIRDINAFGLAYQLASDEAARAGIKRDIESARSRIVATLAEIEPSLATPAGRAALDDFNRNRNAWRDSTNRLIELVDELARIDANTTRIANEMTRTIEEQVLPAFVTRAESTLAEAIATGTNMIWLIITIVIIAIIAGLIISFVLTRNITTGLKTAVGAMKTIADEGNVSFEISSEDVNRKDEIGDMAQAVRSILQQFQNVERLANELAEGNYDVETKVRGDQDTMNINLNKMLDQVNQAMAEIDEGVKQVATGSNEVSSASQALSSGAQESAASLEEITASMSEISSQTKTNAESAGQARDLAQKASNAATQGQEAMKDMTSAMSLITQNSNEIQRVIKVIDDIAFQTNLLALNAAVEAARAGQHGKGFAVVAEEVRNLASRSAKAAKETSELIAKSGHEIERGGEVTSRTAEVLNTIVEQVKQTTDLVAGIAVASNEQAQGVNQVTIGLQQIDSVTQQNTAAAEESASAASEMSSMATNLQKQVDQFKLRNQSGRKTAASHAAPKPAAYTAPKPATAPKPVAPVAKPAVGVKPAAPKMAANPADPVAGDNWGGGKTADLHIDLDDKNFGKY